MSTWDAHTISDVEGDVRSPCLLIVICLDPRLAVQNSTLPNMQLLMLKLKWILKTCSKNLLNSSHFSHLDLPNLATLPRHDRSCQAGASLGNIGANKSRTRSLWSWPKSWCLRRWDDPSNLGKCNPKLYWKYILYTLKCFICLSLTK